MEKSILFPFIGFIVFATKVSSRGLATLIMFLDWFRKDVKKEYSFVRDADNSTLSNNLSAKTGKREAKNVRKSMDVF